MREFIITLTMLVIMTSCESNKTRTQNVEEQQEEEPTRNDGLEGAWKMSELVIATPDGDTLRPKVTQYKLYVDGSVFWGQEVFTDSADLFGYGKYRIDGDTLRENMVSGSWAFRSGFEEFGSVFNHALVISDDSYTQTSAWSSGATVSEKYQRLSMTDRDAMTGAWSLNSLTSIMPEGDTVAAERVQYKVFIDGKIMWGREDPQDSTEWFGFGNYVVEGDSLIETLSSGSNAVLEVLEDGDRRFPLGLKMEENSFTQHNVYPDGSRTYQSYKRID